MTNNITLSKENVSDIYQYMIISITDGQGTNSDGTHKNDYRKLAGNKGVLSIGNGNSGTIDYQNHLIESLEDKINKEQIEKELFPGMCSYHFNSNGISEEVQEYLLKPEKDPNKLSQNQKKEFFKTFDEKGMATTTYLALRTKEGDTERNSVFVLNFGSAHQEKKNGPIHIIKPKLTHSIGDAYIPDGSSLGVLNTKYRLTELLSKSVSGLEREPSDEISPYLPIITVLEEADDAARAQGVDDHFQLGVLTNLGYSSILHRKISFGNKNQTLNYVNSVLSTSIPENDYEALSKGKELVNSISQKFYTTFDDYKTQRIELKVIRNQKDDEINQIEDIEEKHTLINNNFKNKRNTMYKYIDYLLKGELYKIIPRSKRVKELQKQYSKK